jgi:2-dehydro-3-deoxyglucarate aldolase/4-hydroxy-2-oxoheptanedioate aldolase
MNCTSPTLGTWISSGSPVITELAALSGFEWVLIDMEHGNGTEADLRDQLRALNGTSTRGIVRVGAPQHDTIARYLDWGAHGIMVPHVRSSAEAEQIVRAAHYPPRGERGFSRSVRAYHYGLNTVTPENSTPLIIAQIETGESVKAAPSIAAVAGIDVLFIGPADLQLDLKMRPESALGSYDECLQIVAEAAQSKGKASGILLRDIAELSKHVALGFRCIAVDSDLSLLRKGFQQIQQAVTSLMPK